MLNSVQKQNFASIKLMIAGISLILLSTNYAHLKYFLNNKTLLKNKYTPLHLVLWIAVWFFYMYFFSYNSSDTVYIAWFSSALLPVTIFTTYIMVYYLIPKYLLLKKYGLFALYTFYLLIFSAYSIVLIIYACLIYILKFNVSGMPPMSKNFVFVLILLYLVVGLVSFISLLSRNYKAITKNKELENKILSTHLKLKEQELDYLKRQIHPHFLFNTLNTIYGFAIKQSKQTPEIILKLSNLLDYILYQVSKPKVSLFDEVAHIKEYIDLEEFRFQDSLKIKFNANTIDKEMQIAPMMLIPFVENAFKHGSFVNGFLHIEVNIEAPKKQLKFEIKNSFKEDSEESKDGGIGLENIKKRLELNYPNAYKLNLKQEPRWYSVELTITNI